MERIAAGSRVRVVAPGHRFYGKVAEVVISREDAVLTVVVDEPGAMTVHFERDEVEPCPA